MSLKTKKETRILKVTKKDMLDILNKYYGTCELLDIRAQENIRYETIAFILTVRDYPQ